MNTETMVCNILGLGAGANISYDNLIIKNFYDIKIDNLT